MTSAQIAHAISQLERAGLPLQNTFHNMNMWRASPPAANDSENG